MSLSENTRSVLHTVLCAGAAAASAILFRSLTNRLFAATFEVYAGRHPASFALLSLATILSTSLLVGLLLYRFSPESAGSGIPELKTAYWKDLGWVPFKSVVVKFVAGVLSLGGGASLGREGPSVFIGGGIASNVAGFWAHKSKRRTPAMIGAAAGLAAAFNTPLAAITFVLEELIGDLSARAFAPVVLAAVTGAFLVYGTVGRQPAFSLPDVSEVSWSLYVIVPIVALLAAGIGIAFQRGTLAWRKRIRANEKIPPWLRPSIGGILTWALGCSAFLLTGRVGIFGLGYADLSQALNNNVVWEAAAILVAAKLAATIASYSWGGCGGLFSPTLFLGGFVGLGMGDLIGHWIPLSTTDHVALATVGMSACLGAVVRAPLTSLLIVFEMTHCFSIVPALMLGTVISQTVARLGGRHNFYDAMIEQDGHELFRVKPLRDLRAWRRLPISIAANRNPVVLTSLDEASVRLALQQYPYSRFPVQQGTEQFVVTRVELQRSMATQQSPRLDPAVLCHIEQTFEEVEPLFLKTTVGMLIVIDQTDGTIEGVLTLHDLLRAQASAVE